MKTFVEQASRVNTLTDQVNHMLERVLMFLKQLPRTFVHWNECIHPRWQLSLLTSRFPTVHWNGYPYSSIFLKPNSAHLYIKLNYIRTWERVFTFLNSCPVVDGLTPSATCSLIFPRWAFFFASTKMSPPLIYCLYLPERVLDPSVQHRTNLIKPP